MMLVLILALRFNFWCGLALRFGILPEVVAPRACPENAARVEAHEDRGGEELRRNVQGVEPRLCAWRVLRAWRRGEEGRRRVTDDGYAVYAHDTLRRGRGIGGRKYENA